MTPDVVIDGEYSTQGWNRYMYVKGNPLVYRDPTGHNVFSDVWAGMKERAGTYANMGSAIKNAATNPGQFAKVVKQKVADKLHYYKDNKTQLLKDYGSAVAAPFKQLSGYNLIKGTEEIVRSNNPAKALGGKIVDAGVNVALNAAGAGVGKVVGSAAKGVGNIAKRTIPLGFKNASQYKNAMSELGGILNKMDVKDARFGVSGSSVSGKSFKTGKPFGPHRDLDVFVESGKLTKELSTSKKIPGFVHPEKMHNAYPELRTWSEKWTQSLGREVSIGGFQPGTLPKRPTIFWEK